SKQISALSNSSILRMIAQLESLICNCTSQDTLKTNPNNHSVREIIPENTLDEIKEVKNDNRKLPPDIYKKQTISKTEESKAKSNLQEKSKTPNSKNIKKNNIRTKTPRNPSLYTKWVPVIKETKPMHA